jgi:hypothetical protein
MRRYDQAKTQHPSSIPANSPSAAHLWLWSTYTCVRIHHSNAARNSYARSDGYTYGSNIAISYGDIHTNEYSYTY